MNLQRTPLRTPAWDSWDHRVAGLALGLGIAALVGPTGWRLAQWVWPTDEQGHGPVILAASAWLMWRAWPRLREQAAATVPQTAAAAALMALGLIVYALGRSQAVLLLEVGALLMVGTALVLGRWGLAGLRVLAFPLFFLLFMIPLPEALVAGVTAPLKAAVSLVATHLLQSADLPVARTGVMLTAGPYQLLVADACAGLNTLFTLEALGLLYLHLMGHVAWWRNVALAVLVLPISFAANVTRVITLVLVTLHWGDDVGQGYAHDFAGMTLFGVALVLMLATDGLLGAAARALRSVREARA